MAALFRRNDPVERQNRLLVRLHAPCIFGASQQKPAIEVAINNLNSFKSHLHEALSGFSEITDLLRQAIHDQRSNEREIQSVRQTLRSLQGVKI